MELQRCNNTSVGILVWRADRLLLIERRKPPYGWAPPAGHVDDGETYLNAAHRELREEVELKASLIRHVLTGTYQNQCRRPGGDFHHWQVFEATCFGEPVRSEDETYAIKWASGVELGELSHVSSLHMRVNADPVAWQRNPGLEPVWMEMLSAAEGVKISCLPTRD